MRPLAARRTFGALVVTVTAAAWLLTSGLAPAHPALREATQASVLIRQYAKISGGIAEALIEGAKASGATGIHWLTKVASAKGADFVDIRQRAKATRAAGLDVVPGVRILPGKRGYVREVFAERATVVDALATLSTTGTFVLDAEAYPPANSAECKLPPAQAKAAVAPLGEALLRHQLCPGWYPASVDDTCMAALFRQVGCGEAWVEHSFGSVGLARVDNVKYAKKLARISEDERVLRERLPMATIRRGYFDHALRTGIGPRIDLPKHIWVFDRTRVADTGGKAERARWGRRSWHSGESVSTLNGGVVNVWQFQPLGQDPAPLDWRTGAALFHLWDGTRGKQPPGTQWPRPHRDGYAYDQRWHGGTDGLEKLDAASVMFTVQMPDDLSGVVPLAGSWVAHPCCRVWAVFVKDATLRLAIGVGERNGRYTFGKELVVDLGRVEPGALRRVVFGYDRTRVHLPGRAPVLLPAGKETNNIRADVTVGMLRSDLYAKREVRRYARAGTAWRDQLVRWNRVLSDEEMRALLATSDKGRFTTRRYPFGL